MAKIEFSELESKALNIKIGRVNLADISNTDFVKQIIEEKYDCCIAKIDVKHKDISLRLEEINLPYFSSGITRRYKKSCRKQEYLKQKKTDWEIEVYTPKHERVLEKMIQEIFKDEPLTYYELPFYNSIVSKEEEINSLFLYLKSFVDYKKKDIQKQLFLLKIKESKQYYGLCAMIKYNNINKPFADTVLSGILPQFRGQNRYQDLIKYLQKYYKYNDFVYHVTGARIQNRAAQFFLEKAGGRLINYTHTYHFFPFLSKKEKSITIEKDISGGLKLLEIHDLLKQHYAEVLSNEYYVAKLWNNKFFLFKDAIEKVTLAINLVINVEEQKKFVIQVFCKDKKKILQLIHILYKKTL